MSDATLIERDGSLVIVSFNRPEKKNALGADNWNDLDAILTEVEKDPDVRALVLTGAGGNFSSGADLAGGGGEGGAGGMTGRGVQPILHEMRIVGRLVSRLHNLPIPTIAAVDGVCVGVALGLALACDLVVATERARFSEVFVKRGLALDGGTSWLLPQVVGMRRAKQMAYFGDIIDAPTAQDWGMVNEVVPVDAFDGFVRDWGRRLAAGPTTAISLIKSMLDASPNDSLEDALEAEARAQHIVFGTKDIREGMKAFFERRDPEFTGR